MGKQIVFANMLKKEMNGAKVIRSPKMIDDKGNFTDDGIFSRSIFGTLHKSSYSCKCGEITGKFMEGIVCDKCKTKVIDETHYGKTGWISLDDYRIIHPVLYNFIAKIAPIEKIISKNNVKKIKYSGIGLDQFRLNFKKILDFYYNKNKNKKRKKIDKHYKIIIDNMDKIFIDKIFIMDISLRIAVIKNNMLKYDDINIMYNNILRSLKDIDKPGVIDDVKKNLIFDVQMIYNNIYKYVVKAISGKSGMTRKFLLGARTNFSSRSIIVPGLPDHKIDEAHIPYITFLELFRYHIIHLLVKELGYDHMEAQKRIWKAMLVFDEKLYNLATKKLIVDRNTMIILNRNPTIAVGSIMGLRIGKVKKDIKDYTTSIHNNILPVLAADYDGDVLNIILMIDDKFGDWLTPLKPSNLIIDVKTGHFNSSFSLKHDSITGLYTYLNQEHA